jgi:hypothetical protein
VFCRQSGAQCRNGWHLLFIIFDECHVIFFSNVWIKQSGGRAILIVAGTTGVLGYSIFLLFFCRILQIVFSQICIWWNVNL